MTILLRVKARAVLAILVAAGALTLSACGHEKATVAETEGVYLDLGEMKYQVQISRQVNPTDPQDFEFFRGLPPGMTTNLPADEIWFGGVHARREPDRPGRSRWPTGSRSRTRPTRSTSRSSSTRRPTRSSTGPASTCHAVSVFPIRDTLGDQSFAQGGLLLFKLKTSVNQNRPLVLHISNTQGTFNGEVDLDF